MNTDRLLLPDNLNPSDSVCVTLTVPNDIGYLRAVDGAILRIAQWQAWQRDPDHNALIAAANMRQTYLNMVWGDCVVADKYRINPDDICQLQVSHDNGVTWVLFWDVSDCFNTLSTHFLVDNPGVVRENGINPASGHFGIEIISNHQVGLGIDQSDDTFPAADFFQGSTADNAYPPLRLGRASPGRGYIELVYGTTRRDAISKDMVFRSPYVSSIPLNATNEGGLYVKSTNNRGYLIVRDGGSGWLEIPIGIGDGTLTSLTKSYTLLASGATPRLLITGSAPTLNIDLGLPPIPGAAPNYLFNGAYLLLTAGSDPVLDAGVAVVDGNTVVTYTMKLPPIPLPTDFSVDNVEDNTVSQPTLDLQVIGTGSLTTVKYTLKSPPAFDATLPEAGQTKHYTGIEVLADGSTLPFMIPNGFSIDTVQTRGLWHAQRALADSFRPTNGVHDPTLPAWPYNGDLVAQASTGAVDADGFVSGTGTDFDIIADGFLATEDCWIKFRMAVDSETDPKGSLLMDFDLTAPSAGWTITVTPSTSGWTLAYGTQGGAVGSGGGGPGVYLVLATATYHFFADTVVTKLIVHSNIIDPHGTNSLTQRAQITGQTNHTNVITNASGDVTSEFDVTETPGVGDIGVLFEHNLNTADYPTNAYNTHLTSWVMHGTGTIPTIV